ncbi:hypothetical protein B0H13DRAFT_2343751 [Mycena leptocephala]|nr:hypothetical protein B0H13DRAFT_2343751 [Mycena leptocephala]
MATFRANHPHLFINSSTDSEDIHSSYTHHRWHWVSSSRLHLTHIGSALPPTPRGAPCERVPCSAHTPLSRPRTTGIYTPLFTLVPPDMRSSTGTGMQISSLQASYMGVDMCTDGNVVSYPSAIDMPSRTTPAGKYRRGSPCLPTIPPAAAYFPFLAARLPPSCAGALHASQEAHSVMDTTTLFHFRCTTQLSNVACAEFSACRDDGYEVAAGAYMDLDDRLHLDLAPSHLRATRTTLPSTYPHSALFFPSVPLHSSLRSLFTSMYNANTRSSQTPTRAPFGTTGPIPPPTPPLPPPPPPATSAAPQHEHRNAAHKGAPEAQAQYYEDYDARFLLKHHCTDISPFSAAPLLTPASATHCGGSGHLFFGEHFPAWEVCRFAGRTWKSCVVVSRLPVDARTSPQPLRGHPVWALCPCPSSFLQTAPCTALLYMELADVGDLAGILILLREGGGVALWLCRETGRHAFPLTGLFLSPSSSLAVGPTIVLW